MKSYETWPAEWHRYQDRITGVQITQLTDYLGHNWHTYFTNNGWWDDNKRLLFNSDRNNAENLYSIEIATGEISRLTDFKPHAKSLPHFANDVNHVFNESYFTLDNTLYALNLETLAQRPLYTAPAGFNLNGGLVGADGLHVYAGLNEDLSSRIYTNLGAGYVGMRETFYAHPDCRIVEIDTQNGGGQEIWQENLWVGHINPSPTRPDLISFCHEGPWQLVDHRIWVLDLKTGKASKLRERVVDQEKIGHEYWLQDGEHVGYQVHQPDGHSFFGSARYDGTEQVEAPCVPLPSPDHIHSNTTDLIVSDSGKSIKLYAFNGKDYDPARLLCMHDGSFAYGSFHPHPRFTEDGKQILFNSTQSGYCQLYLVDVPADVTALPWLDNGGK